MTGPHMACKTATAGVPFGTGNARKAPVPPEIGRASIRPFIAIFLVLSFLASGASLALAGEPIYSQPINTYTSFYSFKTADGTGNYEAADDFDIQANIDRVVIYGYLSYSSFQVQGAIVRFYAVGADGAPGNLRAQYVVDAGPNLVLSSARAESIDITLPSAFVASGKHFISVQPVTTGAWNWWNSNYLAPRGQALYTRVNGGAWAHPISIVTGSAYPSDLAFTLYGALTAPANLTGVSPTTQTRSGYLEIFGANTGFSGQVLIDGLPAPVANWTSGKIVAYVPEASRLGTVPVQVVTTGGTSNALSLNVTERQPSGRVKWRFRMDGLYSQVRPAIAPDGTVYAIDVYSHLYALTPDGGLKWLVRGAGNKGVAVGRDGSVYVGSESTVKAFNPDGTSKWTFTQNPRAFILIGLSVGPDGNIYGVATQGMGVFSLTPEGQLRWTNPETYSRPIVTYSEIVFGPNGSHQQLYFYANNHLRALRLDGSSVFTLYGGTQPAIGPDGSIHTSGAAYAPNGTLIWSFPFPAPINVLSPADVGSDGMHYVVQNLIQLRGLGTNGSQRWQVTLPSSVQAPNVDPLNIQLVMGSMNTLDHAGFIQSVSAASGKELWKVDLPPEPGTNTYLGIEGFNQYADTRARFTPDGQTAYMATATAGSTEGPGRGFLYAIHAGTGSTPPPPPPPPPTVSTLLRSTDISLSAKEVRRAVTITGLVTVKDENNTAVSGATVAATWTLPNGTTAAQSATTDTAGAARFSIKSSRGTYTLTVSGISKTGYTFDAANSVLSKSITK